MTKGLVESIKRTSPGFNPATIFDVGANTGQSADYFLKTFPQARIQCFEPASTTFETLSQAFASEPRVTMNRLALDHQDREVRFLAIKESTGNRIISSSESFLETETVSAIRGDRFCRDKSIGKIDILKVDTEGNDLNVLVVFVGMLQGKKVGYIQVECTTSPDNHFHVQLTSFMNFLNPFGYRLFGLFEYTRRIYRTGQKLNGIWFCNAVFVREVENPKLRKEMIN